MRLTHYDELKKRWQINNDYGAVTIDELNYAIGEAVDKLAAYEDAEEQGRLVILPCKVGDTVYKVWYTPCKFGEDHPDSIGCEGCTGPCDIKKTICEEKASTKAWIVQTFCGPGRSLVYFLTRKEAEAAMKGEKTNKIKVGDEITTDCGDTFIVTQVAGNCLFGIDKDGKPYNVILPHARKTGRYFAQIAETLKQAKGENNA